MSRIVAGRFGGRVLATVSGSATRPTSARVREAVFGRLDHLGVIEDARVLDLYAGSGALGLEAISRGASDAVLVDKARSALVCARRNVTSLGVGESVQVLPVAVRTFLSGDPRPFDLVLLDPPYELPEATLAADLGQLTGWLSADAVVVVERATRTGEPRWPDGLVRVDRRGYGDTTVWFAEPADRSAGSGGNPAGSAAVP